MPPESSRSPIVGQGRASWEALGSLIVLRVSDAGAVAPARGAVERELDAIDRACSRFRTDSELSWVNACAGRSVRVGPLLLAALEVALRAAELTGGDVDPTVGRALELAGYDRDWQQVAAAGAARGHGGGARGAQRGPRTGTRVSARVLRGWRALEVDHDSASVRVPAGVRLDLGATGKAWAADRCAAAAAHAGRCGALVAVGGDIATCGSPPASGWLVRVTDDHRSAPSAPGQTIVLRVGGLATSSTAIRRWRRGDRDFHHIIDPRTQAPASGTWRTVSVAAADCTEANTAATAALVRGEGVLEWLRGLGLPARLVSHDGTVTTLCGWPDA